MDIDPKRTGVRAREIPAFPSPADEKARFFGEPGDMIRVLRFRAQNLLWGFNVACPGCGQFGAIAILPLEGPRWTVVGGSTDDVTTLSLQPSILKHCCGWHGYLTNGTFVSC